jgi:hypothetical protein
MERIKSTHTKLNNPCLQKAADDEPIFVLRASDKSAPQVIGYWIQLNLTASNEKLRDAVDVAKEMEAWPNRKQAD